MKKVILSLFLSLIFLVYGKANHTNGLPLEWPKVTITLEIGQIITCIPYWSVCRADVTIGTLAATVESFPNGSGSGSGGGGGGSWKLSILRENFAKYYPNFLVKLDGKNTVTFEGSYTMPVEIQNALGSKNPLVIKGNVSYPLKYENGEFVITFPL